MKCATCNMPHANVNAFVVAFVAVAFTADTNPIYVALQRG